MDITIISKRYASAFFSLAQEQGLIEPAYQDMLLVSEVISENKHLGDLLKSPVIPTPKKVKIIKTLFGNKLQKLSIRFLELVLKKDRAILIRLIADSYIELYKDFNNIVTIKLVTASMIDEETRKELLEQLTSASNKTVDLVEEINPSLIGGFVLKLKDSKYDASLRRKIELLGKDFEKNPYVKEY
ncbi:MAG: ATP synthase F1 subunit delta [Bacteroidales bacterium]|nr:ATP synthase F1 subunit delta [Bacteroidales bacterium]